MFRKKVDEEREILLQSFYNLEDKISKKLAGDMITVAVTATDANTQKTESLVNIGRHLAEDGDRVLILDANLRYAELPKVTGGEEKRGFIDIVLGDYQIDDTLIRDGSYSNLYYMYTGEVVDYADKFLEPKDINTFFSTISERFDYVFIDLSPNIDIPEANMFAANADATIVFANSQLANSPITRDSLKQLEKAGANVLGIVIANYEYNEDEIDDLFGGDNE